MQRLKLKKIFSILKGKIFFGETGHIGWIPLNFIKLKKMFLNPRPRQYKEVE